MLRAGALSSRGLTCASAVSTHALIDCRPQRRRLRRRAPRDHSRFKYDGRRSLASPLGALMRERGRDLLDERLVCRAGAAASVAPSAARLQSGRRSRGNAGPAGRARAVATPNDAAADRALTAARAAAERARRVPPLAAAVGARFEIDARRPGRRAGRRCEDDRRDARRLRHGPEGCGGEGSARADRRTSRAPHRDRAAIHNEGAP